VIVDQYHTINKLPRRTAQEARITSGLGTGKKLPHAALSGCNQPHEAYNPVGIHQMAPPWAHIDKRLLLICRPRKDERLSWPRWLTCSGRFTHIVVTRWPKAERRTGSVRRPKTGVLPTVPRNQLKRRTTTVTCRLRAQSIVCDNVHHGWSHNKHLHPRLTAFRTKELVARTSLES